MRKQDSALGLVIVGILVGIIAIQVLIFLLKVAIMVVVFSVVYHFAIAGIIRLLVWFDPKNGE